MATKQISPKKKVKDLRVNEIMVVQPNQARDFDRELNSIPLPYTIEREFQQGHLVIIRTA